MPGIGDALGGATPWGAVAEFGIGALQSIIGGINARKTQRKLENLQTPTYTPSKSITDYYNTALQRYNQNPYQTQQYQYARNAANANMAAGLGALQDRRSAIAGVSNLAALGNNAALKAGVAAEQEQNQRFGQLGGASQMKAGEDRLAFQYNKLAPYEKQYNLLAMRAGANAQTANAGIQNMFGGLGNIQNYQMANKLYGVNNTGNNNFNIGASYSPSYSQAKQYGLIGQ